jgi:hypothetical protein
MNFCKSEIKSLKLSHIGVTIATAHDALTLFINESYLAGLANLEHSSLSVCRVYYASTRNVLTCIYEAYYIT